jgi:hypothetical protein
MKRVIGVLGAVARSVIGSPPSGTTVIHGARVRFGEVHRALGRTPCARPRRMDRLGRLTPFWRSRRAALVPVVQATEDAEADDLAQLPRLHGSRDRRVLAQR